MPISPTTLSELKNVTAQFDFLLTASNIKIKNIPPDNRLCVICQSPFSNDVWKPCDNDKAPINRPVQLPCGHIFGIQCLAHLVFTSDFNNRCPLCRATVIPDSFSQNPSGQSWKAAVPLLRLLMMFGAGEKERENFDKGKAIDVLLNGLEKEGLTGPSKGKHMHRIMVLYEEFLGLFCEQPKPPTTTTMTTGDAARLEAAGERERRLRDLVRDSQELHRVLEEPRALQTRRQELARSEAERELRDVKEEVRGVREELLESREALQDAEDELEEARKKGRGTEKELEGVKKELMEIGDKARKDWEEIENQLEEIIRKLQHGFEEAEENGRKKAEVVQKEAKEAFEKAKKEFERTKGSLKAKAALASSLPLLALILALVWGYF